MSINRQHRRQIQRQGQAAGGDGRTGASDARLVDGQLVDGQSGNGQSGTGQSGNGQLSDAELVGQALADTSVDDDLGDAEVPARARSGRGATTAIPPTRRVAPRQFLHEVNVELRKVAWPSRAETINYSTVVFVTLAVLMALIFGLDLVFTKLAGFLFNP